MIQDLIIIINIITFKITKYCMTFIYLCIYKMNIDYKKLNIAINIINNIGFFVIKL